MKKLITIIALSLVSFAFALEAKVVSTTGKVELQEGNTWVALQKGDTVEKGAVISTGFKSEAVLEVKGTKFTLGALTRAKLENLLEESDKDTTELFLDSGKINADVNKEDGKRVGFKVRSPIATASVRGTQFTYTASGTLKVDRGLVSFSHGSNSNEQKGTPVAKGQKSTASETSTTCSNPAQENMAAATGGNSSTTTLAQKEAITSYSGSQTTTASTNVASEPSSINVKLVLND